MRSLLFLCVFFTVQNIFCGEDNDIFKLSEINTSTQVINNKRLEKNCSFNIDTLGIVSGFAVSGDIEFDNETDSHVRITVEDNNGLEYLVFESYPMLSGQKTFSIDSIAYESIFLDNVKLKHLNINLHKAKLNLDAIHFTGPKIVREYGVEGSRLLTAQAKDVAARLNSNLIKKGGLWRAGKTSISDLTYEEKKSMFGNPVPQLYGLEFYIGGVFQIPNSDGFARQTSLSALPPSVEEWDWRNRHGKNWMTSVKDQGWCQSCWAFSAIGALEPYTNLYYNRILDYDLSEQQLITYANAGSCDGGFAGSALSYIKQNGIVTEECFPYGAVNTPAYNICTSPTERIYIGGYTTVSNTIGIDSLKHLIRRAPFVLGIRPWRHSVVLMGYKVIHAGDTIFVRGNQEEPDPVIVPTGSSYIGQTAWLIKNSYTLNSGFENSGYMYLILPMSDMYHTYLLQGNITSSIYSNNDIICEDADGDGYYFWGLGSKPVSCPSWVPDSPDGDDSDYTKGPMDNYGWLLDLNPNNNDTLYIDTNTTWNTYRYQHKHVCIRGNATLEVCDTVKCYQDVSITVKANATLRINGGTIEMADIKVLTGGDVKIENNGHISPMANKTFSLPLGAKINILSGRIN